MRRRFISFLALCTVGLVPRVAAACTCMGPQVPCEASWQVDAIFVAQVTRIESLATRVRVHLLPLEALRGPGSIVSIETGRGGGDCGYAFRTGETYLIYANGNEATGRYSTGICSRTRPISQAAEDLEYLHSIVGKPSNLGVIRGTVVRSDQSYGGLSERKPYPGIGVTVAGGGISAQTQTDKDGRYQVTLPAGEYEVSVDVPEGLYPSMLLQRIQLRDARGCAESNIALMSDGRVTGRVVDARGQPVAGLPVELVARVSYGYTRHNMPVATRADGTYEFTRVPPGTFLVAIDTLRPDASRRGQTQRVFLPGTLDAAAAQPVVLRPTERVQAPDLVMPDTTGFVRVSGFVHTLDGNVVPGAHVYLRIAPPTSRFFFGPAAVSDKKGEFAMMVPGDETYEVVVELPGDLARARGLKLTVRPAQGDRWIDIEIPPRRQ